MNTAAAALPESNFATIALEVRLAETASTYAEMSFACELGAMSAGSKRVHLMHTAAVIGLSPQSTSWVLDEWQVRARHLQEAYLLIKALIPFEEEIRALIEHKKPRKAWWWFR